MNFQHGDPDQTITAESYGYGSDLNHWAANITKLQLTWRPLPRLTANSTLLILWGFPGSDDFRRYANDAYDNLNERGTIENFVTDPANYNPYDQIQARLNLGIRYAISKHFNLGFYGDNLLGLFDGNLNNRLFLYSSQARQDAVSGGISVSARF